MKYLRFLFIILGLTLMFAYVSRGVVFADTLQTFDQEAINGWWVNWDTQTIATSAGCSGTSTAKPGPVFVLGDSIGTQLGGLQTAMSSANAAWSVTVDAVHGRTLPEGITEANAQKGQIASATAVVIELGTNTGGFTTQAVDQMADFIHSTAPNATMYWIDTASVLAPPGPDRTATQTLADNLKGVNGIIGTESASKNYKIISWNKAVFGSDSDPTRYNPAADDHGNIRRSDQYVHLTDTGINTMTNLIVGNLTGTIGAGGSTSNACACTPLIGADNREKVWNYLRQKGLSPQAAAGVMGNLQAEAGFDPKRVEDGGLLNGQWVYSKDDYPHDMDTIVMPPAPVGPQGQPGYGIVQWTSLNRKQGLIDLAAAQGKPVYDLGLQLDYMWQELNAEPYKSKVYDEIINSTDLIHVTQVFGAKYEVFGSNSESKREGFARAIFQQYGSNSVPPPGGGTC